MLYAQIFQVALKPGAAEQVAELFRTEVGPVLKQQPGYATSRFLTNAATNRCLAVMLWESEPHRQAAEASPALQAALGHLQPCFEGAPTIDYYELAVQV